MKYPVEMDSGVVILKDWFRLSKFDKGNTQTCRQHCDLIKLLLFFPKRHVG
jgi:hypothetical protein